MSQFSLISEEMDEDAEDAEDGMDFEASGMANMTTMDEDFDEAFAHIGDNLESFGTGFLLTPLCLGVLPH